VVTLTMLVQTPEFPRSKIKSTFDRKGGSSAAAVLAPRCFRPDVSAHTNAISLGCVQRIINKEVQRLHPLTGRLVLLFHLIR
jgi:hypothetical protein